MADENLEELSKEMIEDIRQRLKTAIKNCQFGSDCLPEPIEKACLLMYRAKLYAIVDVLCIGIRKMEKARAEKHPRYDARSDMATVLDNIKDVVNLTAMGFDHEGTDLDFKSAMHLVRTR